MGQSRQSKIANQRNQGEYDRVGRQYDDFYNTRNQFSDEARGRSDQAYDTAFSGYQDVFDNPGGSRGSNPSSRYYDEFARTGGLNDENIRRIRGNGVFDEFSKTGGLSDEDIANMRLYGSRTIPGFFDSVRRNLDKSTNITGYNPGYNAQNRASVRDQARAAQEAALNTELGITNQRNQGRMWGTEGLSGAESRLVDATQRGKMFGIEGMDSGYRFDSDMNSRNRLAALEGMRGLRTDVPGEVAMYESNLMDTMGAGAGARRGLNQDYMQYNPNQNWFDKYGMPLIQAGAGVAAGFASGGASRVPPAGAPSGGGSGSFSNFYNRFRR